MREPIHVILLHWQRPDEAIKSAQAFFDQTVPIDLTIIDNGSPPELLAQLKNAVPQARYVELPKNVGFGPGMNIGLRAWLAVKAGGDVVVLAPHDALPKPDCVERIIFELNSRPRAGIACAEFGQPKIPGYHWLKGPYEKSTARGNGWEDAAFPNGTLMVFRRQCLQEIGIFDEQYFAYTEEYEIALRAKRAGWETGIVWGAMVENPIHAAASKVMWYLIIRNQLLAVYQTSGRLRAILLTMHMLAGYVARIILMPQQRNDGDQGSVRWRAIVDFWRGRLGRPSMLAD